ncbi:MAG: hypothetical protein VCF25_09925 [Candidatus Poribacteria bacterium]|jgi:hypothetical protein
MKYRLMILISLFFVIVCEISQAQVEESLVVYFNFEEGVGKSKRSLWK